jgi:hypothetical protein
MTTPKGWYDGHPVEHQTVLGIDPCGWRYVMATWMPGYGWYVLGRQWPESGIALWRPLPIMPPRPSEDR